MKIIGLDVGEKRIGVAKVDSNTKIAVPVGFLLADGSEWQEITRLARLNGTNCFVLGLPRSNEGNETKQTLYVRNFARTLTEKIPGAKVRFQDESLTSVEAESRLKARKKKYEKGDIDAEAAAIILQDFVENLNTKGFSDAPTNSIDKPENEKTPLEKALNPQQIAGLAKKEADKITLNSKKASSRLKKWTVLGIPLIVIVVGLAGATIALKYRDFKRQAYEEEMARIEAEMQAVTFNFTIRPGETIFDVKKNLLKVNRNGEAEDSEIPNYTEAEVDAALKADYDFEFLKERPAGASLEGYLYPETHNFYGDATVEEVLSKFLTTMGEVIQNNNLETHYKEQGLTLHEGITLASVVQKEASSPEQPTVAQVFLTRLSYGMSLGSDVTVSYALDVVDPERAIYKDNQAALKVDSCYNTRVYSGLPCGPISNPGLTALLAVAAPSDTAYLYFLTGDDGLMYYGSTEAEHIQNINLHCQTLCNVSL